MLDGAVSISAMGFMFLGDLSRSVQYQLNQLRDGSSTVVFATGANYALSASTALNAGMIGGVSLSDIAVLGRTNTYLAVQVIGVPGVGSARLFPGSATMPGYVAFHTPDGTRRGYIGFGVGQRLQIAAESSWGYDFVNSGNGGQVPTINGQNILHTGSTLNASSLGTGTVPNAQISLGSVQQHQASLNVNSALTAANATLAATASNAQLVDGRQLNEGPAASTVAGRNSAGDIFARYFNMAAGIDNTAADAILHTSAADGYIRRSSLAYVGAQLETRNISGRAGIAKSIQSGAGPPSLVGSTNGDLFYYY